MIHFFYFHWSLRIFHLAFRFYLWFGMILHSRMIWTPERWTSAQLLLAHVTGGWVIEGWTMSRAACVCLWLYVCDANCLVNIVRVSVLTFKRAPRCVSPVAMSNVRIDSSEVRPTFKRILSRAESLCLNLSVCRLSHSWLLLQKLVFPRVTPPSSIFFH